MPVFKFVRSSRSSPYARDLPASSRRRWSVLGLVLLLLWSLILGWGLARVTSAQTSFPFSTAPNEADIGTVDVVPERYQFGQQLYLENCATCHVGLPPAVMPSQTWLALIQDTQHYGTQIAPIREPALQLIWNYLSTYSRPIVQNERVPFRLAQSRYFQALHPNVEFPQPVSPNSCTACHPSAAEYNFRRLTPEWETAS